MYQTSTIPGRLRSFFFGPGRKMLEDVGRCWKGIKMCQHTNTRMFFPTTSSTILKGNDWKIKMLEEDVPQKMKIP
jgi:hypothetical protein